MALLKNDRKQVENTLISLGDLVTKYQQEDLKNKTMNGTDPRLTSFAGKVALSAVLAAFGLLLL